MRPRLPSTSIELPLKAKVIDKANRLRLAQVLEKREDPHGRIEFYVHYDGQDKRLDEWVCSSRIKRKFGHSPQKSKEDDEVVEKRPSRRSARASIHINYDEVIHKQHEEATKVKYIEKVRYGNYELDTWYFSPYPDSYGKAPYLYVCDKCLRFMKDEFSYRRHLGKCNAKSPPGSEVYADRGFSVYEVSGKDESFFCQCLCLFAKLFLDDKTIHFYTADFIFYVLCVHSKGKSTIAGFFSKEIGSESGCNLNCLLVLPQHQRKGYGKLLIQLSYEISIREGVIGSPEKPLSDMGLASYRSYWAYVIVSQLQNKMDREPLSLNELSRLTHINVDDLWTTVNWLGLYNPSKMAIVGEFHTTFSHLKELSKTLAKPPTLLLNKRLLRWKSS